MNNKDLSKKTTKKLNQTANKALLAFFVLFISISILDIMGFKQLANALMFLPLIAFFISFIKSVSFIKEMFLRIKSRIVNKQEIFTDDLMDDKKDD